MLPPALVADIGGGAYPAVINILLALAERERTGRGRHLDVAMADNVLTWMYWALGNGLGARRWPRRGAELLTGGSPRYRSTAPPTAGTSRPRPLEDRFWAAFCEAVELPDAVCATTPRDPAATAPAVAERIAARPASHWEDRFGDADGCCSVVRTVEEAAADPAFAERGVFGAETGDGDGATMPALPLPIDAGLRARDVRPHAPRLGEHGGRGA